MSCPHGYENADYCDRCNAEATAAEAVERARRSREGLRRLLSAVRKVCLAAHASPMSADLQLAVWDLSKVHDELAKEGGEG